jgi:hypothetical protein
MVSVIFFDFFSLSFTLLPAAHFLGICSVGGGSFVVVDSGNSCYRLRLVEFVIGEEPKMVCVAARVMSAIGWFVCLVWFGLFVCLFVCLFWKADQDSFPVVSTLFIYFCYSIHSDFSSLSLFVFRFLTSTGSEQHGPNPSPCILRPSEPNPLL